MRSWLTAVWLYEDNFLGGCLFLIVLSVYGKIPCIVLEIL